MVEVQCYQYLIGLADLLNWLIDEHLVGYRLLGRLLLCVGWCWLIRASPTLAAHIISITLSTVIAAFLVC